MKAKRFFYSVPVVVLVSGCASFLPKPPVAGYYESNQVDEDPKNYSWVDGQRHLVTTGWTLTLFPGGKYAAGWRTYIDGVRAHESVLAAYNLRWNSRGTWTLADGHLVLEAVGAANMLTEEMMRDNGRSIKTETSEARITLAEKHWTIDWNQVEYRYISPAPNQSLIPTSASFTPAAGKAARLP